MFNFSGMLKLLQRGWWLLPAPVRQRWGRRLIRAMAPRAHGGLPLIAGAPVTVVGLLGNACGIGEGARLCAASLRELGYPVIPHDVSGALARVNLDWALPDPLPAPAPGGTVILHINPPLTPTTLLLLGRQRTRARRLIGYWAWEQPLIPDAWQRDFPFLHEIWTPSTFCANAISGFTDRPVRVVPHPVPVPMVAPLGRDAFGLPADAFVVLAMLHFGSGFERKNPLAVISAFRQAFGDRNDVRLLLKVTRDADLPWAEQALRAALAGATNIQVIEEVMPRPALMALLVACDALISLHRAEGFGLALAEAMRLGKPVIATGWSGNLQFMDETAAALVPARLIPAEDRQGIYSRSHVWADPDIGAAADWLVRLQQDRALVRRMGAAAAVLAEERLGLEAYRRAVQDALPPISPERS